jgi:hypothetical protein
MGLYDDNKYIRSLKDKYGKGTAGNPPEPEPEPADDDSEADWAREMAKVEARENPAKARPGPGPEAKKDGPAKIEKKDANRLYAKLMSIKGWEKEDRDDLLKNYGFTSTYTVTVDMLEEVEGLIDTFIPRKKEIRKWQDS